MNKYQFQNSEVVIRRCSVKKVFLKISENSFLIKLQAVPESFFNNETFSNTLFHLLSARPQIGAASLGIDMK